MLFCYPSRYSADQIRGHGDRNRMRYRDDQYMILDDLDLPSNFAADSKVEAKAEGETHTGSNKKTSHFLRK